MVGTLKPCLVQKNLFKLLHSQAVEAQKLQAQALVPSLGSELPLWISSSILTSHITSRFQRLVARLLFIYQVMVSFSHSVDEHQIQHSWEETNSFQKSNFSPTHFLPKTITFKAKRNFISRRCLLFCCFYTDRVALNTLTINKMDSLQKLILYKEISKY